MEVIDENSNSIKVSSADICKFCPLHWKLHVNRFEWNLDVRLLEKKVNMAFFDSFA